MRLTRLIVICSLLFLVLTSCATLTGISTSVGVATGYLDEDQADSISKSAEAVSKSFEDITPEQEYYIGRAIGANILANYPPWPDQKANDYLNKLGQALAMASDRPETFGGYHFLILDSEEINAFAAPSGLIFVTRGMLRCATNEDTVASVLAHEIGHVQHRHGLQAIKKSRITTALASVALTSIQVAGAEEVAELTAVFDDSIMDITTTMINNGYSRAFEREADHAAVEILKRVGYDPNALIELLKIMDKRLKHGGLDFAKTHPDPEDRIKDVRKAIDDYKPDVTSSQVRQNRYKAASGNL